MEDVRRVALLRRAFRRWQADEGPRKAAALAFYAVFATAPLLILLVSLLGLALGNEDARRTAVARAAELMGEANASLIERAAARLSRPVESRWAGLAGLGALLLGATGALGELRAGLDAIWRARPRRRGLARLVAERLAALGFILALGALLAASLAASALLSAGGKYFEALLPAPGLLLQGLGLALSFCVQALLFASVYKLLPSERVRWRDALEGGTLCAALFALGDALLGLYLGRSSLASAYGAAGSLVLFLVWANYGAQILYLGAEFTYVRAHARAELPASGRAAATRSGTHGEE